MSSPRRLVSTKVFQQRCYEFHEQSLGGRDAPLTTRLSSFWTAIPMKAANCAHGLSYIYSFCTSAFAARLSSHFSERITTSSAISEHRDMRSVGLTFGIYIPPTNLNIRSCYSRRLHDRVCFRGTTLLGMPDMDTHLLGLPSLHCVGCFRGALCLFCGHSLLLA